MSTSAPSSRLRPFKPVPFGRYVLLNQLAVGGMGEIFLARLAGVDRLCVIKRILPVFSSDSEFVDRFINEARILVKLSHGSICQVLDVGLHDGAPFMALEYVDGKDLRKVIARAREKASPLHLTLSLYIIARVLEALAYAHRKKDEHDRELQLVHRDVSPQNILISYEGEVKVIDFGLAKSVLNSTRTHPGVLLGKFLYMSPEQARHQQVDRRSDLYSVGLCLYELIAGTHPFDDGGQAPQAFASEPSIVPLGRRDPLCPGSVQALVAKALQLNPAERFQTAEEFRGKVLSCLWEIDPSVGDESVSRFMREAFANEYRVERSLLTALPGPTTESEVAATLTPPAGAPQLASVSTRPVERVTQEVNLTPLSFVATPRSPGASEVRLTDGETLPGVMVEGDTSPGVRVEASVVLRAPEMATPTAPPETLPADLSDELEKLVADAVAPPAEVPQVRQRAPRWVWTLGVSAVLAGVLAAAWWTLDGWLGAGPPQAPAPPPVLSAPAVVQAPKPAPPPPPPPAPAAPVPAEDELLTELKPAPKPPVKAPPLPSTPSPKHARPATRNDGLHKQWKDLRRQFDALKRKKGGCEAMGMLCLRFDGLAQKVETALQSEDAAERAALQNEVEQFGAELERKRE